MKNQNWGNHMKCIFENVIFSSKVLFDNKITEKLSKNITPAANLHYRTFLPLFCGIKQINTYF